VDGHLTDKRLSRKRSSYERARGLAQEMDWTKNRGTARMTAGSTMDIAIVFDEFAQESLLAAEQANEQEREVWIRLALMWAAAARQSRQPRGSDPAGVSPLNSADLPA
jgi:hypothetical protein